MPTETRHTSYLLLLFRNIGMRTDNIRNVNGKQIVIELIYFFSKLFAG